LGIRLEWKSFEFDFGFLCFNLARACDFENGQDHVVLFDLETGYQLVLGLGCFCISLGHFPFLDCFNFF